MSQITFERSWLTGKTEWKYFSDFSLDDEEFKVLLASLPGFISAVTGNRNELINMKGTQKIIQADHIHHTLLEMNGTVKNDEMESEETFVFTLATEFNEYRGTSDIVYTIKPSASGPLESNTTLPGIVQNVNIHPERFEFGLEIFHPSLFSDLTGGTPEVSETYSVTAEHSCLSVTVTWETYRFGKEALSQEMLRKVDEFLKKINFDFFEDFNAQKAASAKGNA